jgi:hypothetical protein
MRSLLVVEQGGMVVGWMMDFWRRTLQKALAKQRPALVVATGWNRNLSKTTTALTQRQATFCAIQKSPANRANV